MTEPVKINTADDMRQRLEALLAANKSIETHKDWANDRLSLKPMLDGQQIRVFVPEGDGKATPYQLWIYKGQPTLLTHEQVNEIYEREVLNGVSRPIIQNKNPITGNTLTKELRGDGWVNDKNPADVKEFNIKSVYVNFDVQAKTALVVSEKDWADIKSNGGKNHPQKWWFDADKVPKVGDTVDISARRGVDKKVISDDGARYEFKPVYGYDDPRVEKLHTQAKNVTSAFHQTINGRPAGLEIVIPRDALNQVSQSTLARDKEIERPAPAAKVEAVKPQAPPESYPQQKRLRKEPSADNLEVNQFYRVVQDIQDNKLRELLKAPAGSPERKELEKSIQQSLDGLSGGYKTLGELYVKEAVTLDKWVSADDYKRQAFGLRKGQDIQPFIETKEEMLIAHKSPPAPKKEQEKVEPLPQESSEVSEIEKIRRPHQTPPKNFKNSYEHRPERAAPAPAKTANEFIFMAKPGDVNATARAAYYFLGYEAKNPGLLTPEFAKKAIESYGKVDPALGLQVQDMYTRLKNAGTQDERNKILKDAEENIFKRHLGTYDPNQAAKFFVAAQQTPPNQNTEEFNDKANPPIPREPVLATASDATTNMKLRV